MPGDPAAARLRTDFGCGPRLTGARTFALGHGRLLSRASARQKIAPGSAQQRPATTQTPPRPIGAGGAEERAGQARCPLITTHALFARKVQRKLSNGVAGLAAAGSSLDRQKIAAVRAISAMQIDDQ